MTTTAGGTTNTLDTTSENPDLRYLVGDDALKLMDMRKKASDEIFRKLIIENVLHR